MLRQRLAPLALLHQRLTTFALLHRVQHMVRLYALLLLTLLTPAYVRAQSITVPATVNVGEPGIVEIRATKVDADDVRWYVMTHGIQTFSSDTVKPPPGVFVGLALKEGTYKVGVIPAKAVKQPDGSYKAVIGQPQVVTIIVGVPTPDDPPVPDPKPKPPVPPAPTQFRVLVVYESSQKLSPTQSAILDAKQFRDYLNAKAAKDDKGKPAWRVFDQNTPLDKESPLWQGAMKKAVAEAKGTYPWILIGDGTTGVSQPLPQTLAETMALLRKYGG